jgi:hypothetical protein
MNRSVAWFQRWGAIGGINVQKALLPIADKGGGWDATAAVGRVRKWASSDGSGDKEKMNWPKYARAFFYVDSENDDNFGGYKLPFADIRDGTLKAVPEGIYAAAQAVQGARTPMKVDVSSPKAKIAAYYGKMDERAPWKRD